MRLDVKFWFITSSASRDTPAFETLLSRSWGHVSDGRAARTRRCSVIGSSIPTCALMEKKGLNNLLAKKVSDQNDLKSRAEN